MVSSDYIRTETRKYYPRERRLSDLRSDPGELHDIATREPQTAAALQREWERQLEPLHRRYEESLSTAPPALPFYFPVHAMRLETSDPVGSTNARLEPPQLMAVSTQSWMLERSSDSALFALPERARSGTLALSAPVPKGEYRVSVAVITPEASTATLPAVGYRFSAGEKFQAFEDISPLERLRRETPMNYFLYRTRGWVSADEAFRIELSLPPTIPVLWGVAHVRFEPRGAPPRERPKDDAELRRLMREQGYW